MDTISYYGSYGHSSWLFLVPVVIAIVVRMATMSRRNTRRRSGQRAPNVPAQGFQARSQGYPPSPGPASAPARGIPAGWLRDPSGRNEQRYWSGTGWTEHVMTGGIPGTDPWPDPSRPHVDGAVGDPGGAGNGNGDGSHEGGDSEGEGPQDRDPGAG